MRCCFWAAGQMQSHNACSLSAASACLTRGRFRKAGVCPGEAGRRGCARERPTLVSPCARAHRSRPRPSHTPASQIPALWPGPSGRPRGVPVAAQPRRLPVLRSRHGTPLVVGASRAPLHQITTAVATHLPQLPFLCETAVANDCRYPTPQSQRLVLVLAGLPCGEAEVLTDLGFRTGPRLCIAVNAVPRCVPFARLPSLAPELRSWHALALPECPNGVAPIPPLAAVAAHGAHQPALLKAGVAYVPRGWH